jgi:hypothetical protein
MPNSKPLKLASRYRKGAAVLQRDLEALNQIIDLDEPPVVHQLGGIAFYAKTLFHLTRLLEARANVLEGRSVAPALSRSVGEPGERRIVQRATGGRSDPGISRLANRANVPEGGK